VERRSDTIVVRSFRVVFDLGLRRLFKVDRFRVPFPYGLPLRGVAYWAVSLLTLLILMRLPATGEAVHALPAPVRYLLLPGGIAYLLLQVAPDGRSAHTAALAWLRYRLTPKRVAAWRAAEAVGSRVVLGEMTFVPDERCVRYRTARVTGPARVLLRYPAQAWRAGRVLHVEQTGDEPAFVGKEVALQAGQRLQFHDRRRERRA
jgi:hypothetical protein